MEEKFKVKHIIISDDITIKMFNELKYFYLQRNIKYSDSNLIKMLLVKAKCKQMKKISKRTNQD